MRRVSREVFCGILGSLNDWEGREGWPEVIDQLSGVEVGWMSAESVHLPWFLGQNCKFLHSELSEIKLFRYNRQEIRVFETLNSQKKAQKFPEIHFSKNPSSTRLQRLLPELFPTSPRESFYLLDSISTCSPRQIPRLANEPHIFPPPDKHLASLPGSIKPRQRPGEGKIKV